LCPLLNSYDIVYLLHSKIRHHTHVFAIANTPMICSILYTFSLEITHNFVWYICFWDLCNTVIPYIEEHGIIRFMMINVNDVTYNNKNRLITWLQYCYPMEHASTTCSAQSTINHQTYSLSSKSSDRKCMVNIRDILKRYF